MKLSQIKKNLQVLDQKDLKNLKGGETDYILVSDTDII